MPSAISTPLTYEILMYLNSFYFGMFATCELCMGIYKAANLPSPGTNKLLIEFALLLFLLSTEAGRIYLGRKGNLMERGLLFLLAIALTVPSSFVTLYFLLWQHYTLRLEVILCSIQIVLLTTELIIAVLCLVSIYRPSTEDWKFPKPKKRKQISSSFEIETSILQNERKIPKSFPTKEKKSAKKKISLNKKKKPLNVEPRNQRRRISSAFWEKKEENQVFLQDKNIFTLLRKISQFHLQSNKYN